MILRPPNYLSKHEGPVVYLAGPIKSAPDWQKEACKHLERCAPGACIINPRLDSLPLDFKQEEQFNWESFHLSATQAKGSVVFWFPANMKNKRPFAYGGKSLVDLGEAVTLNSLGALKNLYVGIEPGFKGQAMDYIKTIHGPIYESLDVLCRQVIKDFGIVWYKE